MGGNVIVQNVQEEILKRRRRNMIEVNCNECSNCTGNSCKKYGVDPNEAVKSCAANGFKNYKKKRRKDNKE